MIIGNCRRRMKCKKEKKREYEMIISEVMICNRKKLDEYKGENQWITV